MSDRGIIFSAPMVRALLDGRKTQTRRILKVPGIMGGRFPIYPPEGAIELEDGEFARGVFHYRSTGALSGPYRLPAAVGDRLYVREAWRADSQLDTIKPREMSEGEPILYETDGAVRQTGCAMIEAGKLRPSIFLPRWASRLTLIVEAVRVEPLQAIGFGDSLAEGVQCPTCEAMRQSACAGKGCFASVGGYRDLWDSLHDKPGERWEDNPNVVALTFRVERGNIDRIGG